MRRVSQRLILVLLLCPLAAIAAEYFGAIAYSPGTGAHGWANNHASRARAEKAAVANCLKYAQDCRPVVWFKNACGALATAAKAYGSGWGSDQSLADIEALRTCSQHAKACTVKQRLCTKR